MKNKQAQFRGQTLPQCPRYRKRPRRVSEGDASWECSLLWLFFAKYRLWSKKSKSQNLKLVKTHQKGEKNHTHTFLKKALSGIPFYCVLTNQNLAWSQTLWGTSEGESVLSPYTPPPHPTPSPTGILLAG